MLNTRNENAERATLILLTFLSFALVIMYIISIYKDIKPEEESKDYTVCSVNLSRIEDVSCSDSNPIVLDDEVIEFDIKLQLSNEEQQEYDTFVKTVFAEGGGINEDESVAIAATILNRIDVELFPDNITDVVFQPGQFDTANQETGEIEYWKTPYQKDIVQIENVPESVYNHVEYALDGVDPTEEAIGGALYFYSAKYLSKEKQDYIQSRIKKSIRIGDTVFYREYIGLEYD